MTYMIFKIVIYVIYSNICPFVNVTQVRLLFYWNIMFLNLQLCSEAKLFL